MDKLKSNMKLGKGESESGAGDSALESSVSRRGRRTEKVLGLRGDRNQDDLRERKKNYEVSQLFEEHLKKKRNMYFADATPLASPWTYWIEKTERGVNAIDYEATLVRIHTVFTVLSFWEVYRNIPQPKDLGFRASIHMMRDNRKPMWEEACNCSGGTFRLCVQKKDTENLWREVLMAAAGEQFDEYLGKSDELCGVSVSARQGYDLVLIWNSNAQEASKANIFECVQRLMPNVKILSKYYLPNSSHTEFDQSRAQLEIKKASTNLKLSGSHNNSI